MAKSTYILLLNWNGWSDTLTCLESVFKLDYHNFRVVICDNASTDGSVDKIKAWLDGRLEASIPDNRLADLVSPVCPKPVSWVEYERAEAERGGEDSDTSPVVIINTGANLGFAGGNNVGLRYIESRDDFDYVWLLNNDTVVDSKSLSHLVTTAVSNKEVGIVGSSLCYYSRPDVMQARGGATFKPFRGKARPIEENNNYRSLSIKETQLVNEKLGYIIGASMLVSKAFLNEVGLMSEDYFLYYEELDWACRAQGKFRLAVAPESIVYHKVGASAGTSVSLFSIRYLYVNQIKFMKKFFPFWVWSVRIEMLRDALRYLRNNRPDAAKLIIRIALGLGGMK